MKLRKPCPHGKYDGHRTGSDGRGWCPGGVFLPDDTLVIEKVDGEWPESWVFPIISDWVMNSGDYTELLDALSVREAE